MEPGYLQILKTEPSVGTDSENDAAAPSKVSWAWNWRAFGLGAAWRLVARRNSKVEVVKVFIVDAALMGGRDDFWLLWKGWILRRKFKVVEQKTESKWHGKPLYRWRKGKGKGKKETRRRKVATTPAFPWPKPNVSCAPAGFDIRYSMAELSVIEKREDSAKSWSPDVHTFRHLFASSKYPRELPLCHIGYWSAWFVIVVLISRWRV